jgi:Zn-dependent membrane protease YugP
LSNDIFEKNSISSVAVATHECGHALQKKEGYLLMRIRTFLVPIVNFSSKIAYILLILGFLLEFAGLIEIAIILMGTGVLFQLVTLPVEINASRRAKNELIRLNIISNSEESMVKNVLIAAALTYVAGLLSSLLELLRLVLLLNGRRK